MLLENSEYDEQAMQKIASESVLFKALLEGLVVDTSAEYPTNELWLGTLSLGREGIHTQVKLVVTQDINNKIDEN
jgi:hypothetical protein